MANTARTSMRSFLAICRAHQQMERARAMGMSAGIVAGYKRLFMSRYEDHFQGRLCPILDDVINSGELGGPNPLNQALETLTLSREEADELRAFLAHPTAFPRVPARRIPEGDRSRFQAFYEQPEFPVYYDAQGREHAEF